MTVRLALLSTLCVALLAGPASATGDQGPHRSLVIGGDCVDCTFEGANLAGAQFLGGDFRNTDFEDAILLGARLVDLNLESANFQSASLIEARFANSGLESANLEDANLDRTRLHQVRLNAANLTDATLNEAVLLVVDLSGADIRGITAESAVFRQVSFQGVRARRANFEHAHFNGSRLTGADLREVNFQHAIFENVDLSGADLREANFDRARLSAVNFSGADLRDTEGLTPESFSRACGSNVQGLPDGVELRPCTDMGEATARHAILAYRASTETQMSQREQRLAEIAIARSAFEQALANVEIRVEHSDQVRLEALAAAREGWEAAAEALAEAEIEVGEAQGEINWSFEISRAELGEPIRVILEQSNPQRIFIARPPETPRPPPSPPAPELPQRANGVAELLGGIGSGSNSTETRTAVFVRNTENGSRVAISAADIGFLIEATAEDFGRRANAERLVFRNVQAGVWQGSDRPHHALLCGEVDLGSADPQPGWQRFTTVRSSEFDVHLGREANAICDDAGVELLPSADLAIRIEQRLADITP